jgi:hypothetical protein
MYKLRLEDVDKSEISIPRVSFENLANEVSAAILEQI